MNYSPGMPLHLHWNQHEDLCAHLATQRPVPSHVWTPVDPARSRPRSAAFHVLWPGEGSWDGGREAELLPPALWLILRTLWSFLLVLQLSVYLLMLRIAARGHILPAAGHTLPRHVPSAGTCGLGHPSSVTCTHICLHAHLCVHMYSFSAA